MIEVYTDESTPVHFYMATLSDKNFHFLECPELAHFMSSSA